jgi:hypothetical protein
MSQQSIAGIYNSMHAAEEALARLDERHFPLEKVSILAQNLESEKQVHGYVTMGDVAANSALTGAWVGGLFGVLVGAAFIWVPGFGPLLVAGPFAAALLGGLEGAAFGAAGAGLLGALVGWGVSKKHVLKYEESLRGGKYMLIIHGTPEEIERAKAILSETDAAELNIHDVQDEPVVQH